MNLHSGCRPAVTLTSVWDQLIYKSLICCLMGSGPASLNACQVAAISHINFAMSKLFFMECYHMSKLV